MSSVTFSKLVIGTALPGSGAASGPRLRLNILKWLHESGYPVEGISTDMFGERSKQEKKAKYVIACTFNEFACEEKLRSGRYRRCRAGVKWEVFDRNSHEVVYRIQTRAVDLNTNLDALVKSLFKLNFDALLSRPRFVGTLKKKKDSSSAGKTAPSFGEATYRACPVSSLSLPGDTDKVLNAVAVVSQGDKMGSGVFVSPDGILLTAAHVVSGSDTLTVKLRDGTKLPATRVRIDTKDDVALLMVTSHSESPCLAPRLEPAKVGDQVVVAGSPVATTLSFSATSGIVSGRRRIDGTDWIQTDASVSPGYSGGPILDHEGRWMGLVSWKILGGGVEGIAFGVPTAQVMSGLAIKPAEVTSPKLLEATPKASKPKLSATKASVDDTPIPVPELDPTKLRRMSNAGSMTTGAGSILAGFGGMFVILGTDSNIAWVSVGGGLGLIALGFALPRKDVYPNGFVFEKNQNRPKKHNVARRRRSSFSVTPTVGIGQVGVFGTF